MYQKQRNTVILRTSFWLQCAHGKWVSDGPHQTSTVTTDIYALVPLGHLSLYPTPEEIGEGVCSQELTTSFMLAQAANHLPARCFLKGWEWYCREDGLLPPSHGVITSHKFTGQYRGKIYLFGPLAGKQFEMDVDKKQVVTSRLQILDTNAF